MYVKVRRIRGQSVTLKVRCELGAFRSASFTNGTVQTETTDDRDWKLKFKYKQTKIKTDKKEKIVSGSQLQDFYKPKVSVCDVVRKATNRGKRPTHDLAPHFTWPRFHVSWKRAFTL